MTRVFSLVAVLTTLMLLVAGGGTYWLSKSDINQANLNATEALAKGISLGLTSQIGFLQKSVSKMAASPEAIAAIESKDPSKMTETATMFEQFIPTVMKLRVLPADIDDLDVSGVPQMVNADLIMVKESLSLLSQMPVIQGQGKDRHLAITSVIKSNGKPIGVILASLKIDFLQSTLNTYQIPNGFIELMQNKASLAVIGNQVDKENVLHSTSVPGTTWNINYWHSDNTNKMTLLSFLGMIFFPAFLSCLACFIGHQTLNGFFKHDRNSLLSIIKDLLSKQNVGSYPMYFNDMEVIGSKIIELKHGLDHEEENNSFKDEISFDTKKIISDISNTSVLESNIGDEEIDSCSLVPNIVNDSLEPDLQKKVVAESAPTIFKANDIRGIVGKTLSNEVVFDIGRALGSEAKEQNISTITIGRDARPSSSELSESLAKGINSTGIDVLDLGLVPSPIIFFVAHHSEGKTGVIVTGSHNPSEYNGLKIILKGDVVAGEKLQKIAQRIDKKDYFVGKEGSVEQNSLFVNEYIGIISEDVHIARSMKVVVDCGNGAAGKIAPELLRTLGCEVVELFCEIDGTFPNHHPDPGKPENLTDLMNAVQEHQADIGIAFDGGGNRLGVIDCKGNIIWPDQLMMLFSKEVLALKPGSEIIYDVKCSRHLGEQIVKKGGRPLMWKSGHSFIREKIKETKAILAGEMSGHIFFNDRWFGFDDALYAASRLIEILSEDSRNSDEVFADFPKSENTPEFIIPLTEEENTHIMQRLFSEANFTEGKIIDTDGMRVEFTDGWGLVRTSTNMPALTLRFEASTVEALQQIQSQFKDLLVKVKPDITIPF